MVKNKISYAYVEIIKHQHTNNRTNSAMPMSSGARRHRVSIQLHGGLRWELGGNCCAPDTQVAGRLLQYLEYEMKLL